MRRTEGTRSRAALVGALWGVALLAQGCAKDAAQAVDASVVDGSVTDAAPGDAAPRDAAPGDAAPGEPPACTGDGAWLGALRGRDPTVQSVLIAPGAAWSELRAALESSADPQGLAVASTIRAQAMRAAPALTPGGTPVYQSLASHALACAWVGWLDDDAPMRDAALADLETAGVDPAFWSGADEVPIRVGASLVALAGAVDLLGAADPARLPAAQAALARALAAVVSWYRGEGELLAGTHSDNFTLRLGAGVLSAALLTPAEPASDALLAVFVAGVARTLDAAQTDGRGTWREGPFYLAYGMEVAPLAWAALDAAWTGPDAQCVECAGELLAVCGRRGVTILRPSRDPVLPALVAWLGHLESHGGWLVPFDDGRPVAWIPAPFERLAGVRSSRAWTASGRNALGGSVQVGPFVAAALARGTDALPWAPREPVSGGVAHLEGSTLGGAPIDAYLVAEDAFSANGGGHERPDPLSLTVAVGGTLMLGPGGYESYDRRALYNAGSQSSLVTIDGLVPSGSTYAPIVGATLTPTLGGATGTLESGGTRWTRTLTLDGSALTIHDLVQLDTAREVVWHWHTRGVLDAGDRLWRVGDASCAIAFEGTPVDGAPLEVRREEAAQSDDGASGGTHAVLRFGGTLSAGTHEVTTRIDCSTP